MYVGEPVGSCNVGWEEGARLGASVGLLVLQNVDPALENWSVGQGSHWVAADSAFAYVFAWQSKQVVAASLTAFPRGQAVQVNESGPEK